MKLRVAGYCRISELTDASTSIDRQRKLIADTCKARGWTLIETVEDVDVSATKTRLARPGLDRVRHLASTGAVDVVLVWRIDRVARSVSDLATLVEEWSKQNVSLVSATEAFDMTTPAGRMLLQLLAVFAEFEAAVIRERVMAGRAALRAQQRFGGGDPPYGYRIVDNPNGQGKALEIDPAEKEIVREMVDSVLAGASIMRAIRKLNDSGLAPRRAPLWRLSSVKAILIGDAILGRMTHKREVLRDEKGYPIQCWDPIITEAESRQLRERFTARGSNKGGIPGQKRKASRLLSGGLLRCSGCEKNMHVGSGGAGAAFSCSEVNHGGIGCPRPVSIKADAIEEHIVALWLAKVGHLERFTWDFETGEPIDLVKVEEAIAAAGRQMAQAASRDDDEADGEVQAILGRIKALKQSRAELKAAPREQIFIRTSLGHTFREAWDAAEESDDPIADRRALLGEALDKVVVNPGVPGSRGPIKPERITVVWADGLED